MYRIMQDNATAEDIRLFRVMRDLVKCNFHPFIANDLKDAQQFYNNIKNNSLCVLSKIKDINKFYFYHPEDKKHNEIADQQLVNHIEEALFSEYSESQLVNKLTSKILKIAVMLKQQLNYSIVSLKPLKAGRYYSLVLLVMPNFLHKNKAEQIAIIDYYGKDKRKYPNSIIIKDPTDNSFWFYDGELEHSNKIRFKPLMLSSAEADKFNNLFVEYKFDTNIVITEPNALTLEVDLILKHKYNYNIPLWRCIGTKDGGFTDGFIVAKAYTKQQLTQQAQDSAKSNTEHRWIYKARLHSYDFRLMQINELTDLNSLIECFKTDFSPIIIKTMQDFLLYYLDQASNEQKKFLVLSEEEVAIFNELFKSTLHKEKLQEGVPSAPLIAMEVNRLKISTPYGERYGGEIYQIIQARTGYCRAAGDYEWYFYENFCEAIGSELFKYILGEAAPQNKLVSIPGQAPGLVSKVVSSEFQDLKDASEPNNKVASNEVANLFMQFLLQEFMDEEGVRHLIANTTDEKQQEAINRHIYETISELGKIIAATCFFNDLDGKLANLGMVIQDNLGTIKLVRIDFGAALSELEEQVHVMGLYFFGDVEVEPYKNANYHKTYRKLLYSQNFQKSVLELANINLEHIKIIVDASVERVAKAWQGVELDKKSIEKFYLHLFGKDKTKWIGYKDDKPSINFDQDFVSEFSKYIIVALAERKNIFKFFANTIKHIKILEQLDPYVANTLASIKNYKMPEVLNSCKENNLECFASYAPEQIKAVMELLILKEINSQAIAPQREIINKLTKIEYLPALEVFAKALRFEFRVNKLDEKYKNLLQNMDGSLSLRVDNELKQQLVYTASQGVCMSFINLSKAKKAYNPRLIKIQKIFSLQTVFEQTSTLYKVDKAIQKTDFLDNYDPKADNYYGVKALVLMPGPTPEVTTIIWPIHRNEVSAIYASSQLGRSRFELFEVDSISTPGNDCVVIDYYSNFVREFLTGLRFEFSLDRFVKDDDKADNSIFETVTQLCVETGNGNLDKVKTLITRLKYMQNNTEVNRENLAKQLRLALHVAVVKNQFNILEYLVGLTEYDFNAVIKRKGQKPCSLLHRALVSGNEDIVEFLLNLLIARGIKFDIDIENTDTNIGLTPALINQGKSRKDIQKAITKKLIEKLIVSKAIKQTPKNTVEILLRRAAEDGDKSLLESLLNDFVTAENSRVSEYYYSRIQQTHNIQEAHSQNIESDLDPASTALFWNAFMALHWGEGRCIMGHIGCDCVKNLRFNSPLQIRNDWTPLHLAIMTGDTLSLVRLLETGANIEIKNDSGETPLHFAASGHHKCMRQLISRGANIEATDNYGKSPLHHAAARKYNTECLLMLINNGANIAAVTKDGYTPLHLAVEEDYTECLSILLNQGANIAAVTNDGYTPLHLAAKKGHTECLSILLNQGANIAAVTKDGYTPLRLAVQFGQIKCAEELIARGTKLGVIDALDDESQQLLAIKRQRNEYARMLQEAYSYYTAASLNNKTITPLFALSADKKRTQIASNKQLNNNLAYHKTAGDGNCAFHALFGEYLNGVYQCGDGYAADRRKKMAEDIRNCKDDSPLYKIIQSCILELILDNTSFIKNTPISHLKEQYDNYYQDNQQAMNQAWDNFVTAVRSFTAITEYIEDFIKQAQSKLVNTNSFKDKFQYCLNEDNGMLLQMIKEIQVLDDAFKKYNKKSREEFNFILSKEILDAYASLIERKDYWLLRNELELVARIFDLKIELYISDARNNETLILIDTYNKETNKAPVKIYFNGLNHYSHMDNTSVAHMLANGAIAVSMVEQPTLHNVKQVENSLLEKRNPKLLNKLKITKNRAINNDSKASSLYEIAKIGNLEQLKQELQEHADVNYQDPTKNNATALHAAVSSNHLACIRELLAAGANINSADNDGCTPLHCAIAEGCLASVALLIDNGASFDIPDKNDETAVTLAININKIDCLLKMLEHSEYKGFMELIRSNSESGGNNLIGLLEALLDSEIHKHCGLTLLHAAAAIGNTAWLIKLLAERSNLEEQNKAGETALHLAAQNGHVSCVMELLARGSKINAETNSGSTPLHWAARDGRIECVKAIIDKGAELDIQNKYGFTPLHLAASNGHVACIALLVENSANTEVRDNYGKTPLHCAVEAGCTACVIELLQKGANIAAIDTGGRTPLHWAACSGSIKELQELIASGANIEAADREGLTSLYYAVITDNVECLRSLIAKHAKLEAQDRVGLTSLHVAAGLGHTACVTTLLENGANIAATDNDGDTPLHWAAGKGHTQCAMLLLENDANIAATNRSGSTPLHWAACSGSIKELQELIARGANIEAADHEGLTSLHYAAMTGGVEGVRELIAKHASLEPQDKGGLTPLHWAAAYGHTACVITLLKKGANIAAIDKDGNTPLHWAAAEGHTECAIALLERGADIAAKDKDGNTPLHWAAGKEHIKCAVLLLDRGADIAATDNDGRTSLHFAAATGCMESIILLLERGANIAATDNDGKTPLHYTAVKGHPKCMARLLERGANIAAADKNGYTSLHLAAAYGHSKSTAALLKSGANIAATDNDGKTPLHLAAIYGYAECVIALLERGADIAAVDKDGETPLHWAVGGSHIECAIILLGKGANIAARDKYGWTPLHIAAGNGHAGCAMLLLQKGANIEAGDNNSQTPLHWAAEKGHIKCMIPLLQKGANTAAVDKNGKTPLHVAAAVGHTECVMLLLERDANIAAIDNNFWTPLHWAVAGPTEGVMLLLQKGANIEAADKNGKTPLHVAAAAGRTECVIELLQKGANIAAADGNGNTPLHFTAGKGHAKCAVILLERGANIAATDKNGNIPLHYAAAEGHTECVITLLDRGANIAAIDKNGQTPLHYAAGKDRAECEVILLERGANIEATDKNGQTPLHYAAAHGCIECIIKLLHKGANIAARDKNGQTPLHMATIAGHIACVACLLERGANIAARDNYGRTPLDWAIGIGRQKCATLLLQNGANMGATRPLNNIMRYL